MSWRTRDSDVPISTQLYWQLAYQIDTGRLHPAHEAELRAEGADDDLLDVCSSVVTLTPSDYLGTGPWPDA